MRRQFLLSAILAAVLSAGPVLCETGASSPDAAAEVRAAETAFAGAFAARDTNAFASFLAEDVVFLSPPAVMRGPSGVMAGWSKSLEAKAAPFSWKPEHVVVNAAGTIGFSTGPVFDAKGTKIAVFTSVWVRQKDGRWKVQFDGPGCAVCTEAPPPPSRDETERKE
jgi:ketosteroid isomerase-like protein